MRPIASSIIISALLVRGVTACGATPDNESVETRESELVHAGMRLARYTTTGFTQGRFILDTNNNGREDLGDTVHIFGSPGDIPLIGRWENSPPGCLNPSPEARIGVYRRSERRFFLNMNGDPTTWQATPQHTFINERFALVPFAWRSGSSSGCRTGVGLFRYDTVTPGVATWLIDMDLNGTFEQAFDFGHSFDIPAPVQDPNSSSPFAPTLAAVARRDATSNALLWLVDINGNRRWDQGVDRSGFFGAFGATPISSPELPFIAVRNSAEALRNIDSDKSFSYNPSVDTDTAAYGRSPDFTLMYRGAF